MATLKDGCVIEDGAYVAPNAVIAPFTVYGGQPGRGDGDGDLPRQAGCGRHTVAKWTCACSSYVPPRARTRAHSAISGRAAGRGGGMAAGPCQGALCQVCAHEARLTPRRCALAHATRVPFDTVPLWSVHNYLVDVVTSTAAAPRAPSCRSAAMRRSTASRSSSRCLTVDAGRPVGSGAAVREEDGEGAVARRPVGGGATSENVPAPARAAAAPLEPEGALAGAAPFEPESVAVAGTEASAGDAGGTWRPPPS